jgi:hypothetical protein
MVMSERSSLKTLDLAVAVHCAATSLSVRKERKAVDLSRSSLSGRCGKQNRLFGGVEALS